MTGLVSQPQCLSFLDKKSFKFLDQTILSLTSLSVLLIYLKIKFYLLNFYYCLFQSVANAKVGFSKAMSLGWIVIDKSGQTPLVKRKIDIITDTVQEHLNEIKKGIDNLANNVRNDYKKRKLLQEVTIKSFVLTKGPKFSKTIKKLETDLTTEMILSGSWKNLEFKQYNFDALG